LFGLRLLGLGSVLFTLMLFFFWRGFLLAGCSGAEKDMNAPGELYLFPHTDPFFKFHQVCLLVGDGVTHCLPSHSISTVRDLYNIDDNTVDCRQVSLGLWSPRVEIQVQKESVKNHETVTTTSGDPLARVRLLASVFAKLCPAR